MVQVLDPRHYQVVVGGISVPNASDRAPNGEISVSDMGTAISLISLFAGLTPAGMAGRSIIFAAGAAGMVMGMIGQES